MAYATLDEAVRDEAKRKNPQGVPAKRQEVIPVLTPTMGVASFWYFTSILGMVWPMNCGKAVIPTMDRKGGEIAQMRNRLVSMMLTTHETGLANVTYVMWIDDDVVVHPWVIPQLVQHERDIVSGVYFSKGDVSEPLIFDGPSAGTGKFIPEQTRESWGWAQGLSLVKLDVYRRMRDELDLEKDEYGVPMWYESPMTQALKNGNFHSPGTEDFPFFDKCNKLGYTCLQDMSQRAFGFHFDIKAGIGYPQKQWEQFERREPVVWPATKHSEEVVWK